MENENKDAPSVIMAPEVAQIIQVIENTGVEPQNAQFIAESFTQFYRQTQEWSDKASALIVTDETQIELMADARTARLALAKVRTGADKMRKQMKEGALAYGNAIQKVYNFIEDQIKPIEQHLKKQEEFKERADQDRLNKLIDERREKLKPYVEDPSMYPVGLMTELAFDELLQGQKIAKEQRDKAEADRVENERIEAERLSKVKELQAYRFKELKPYMSFLPTHTDCGKLGELNNEDWGALLLSSMDAFEADAAKKKQLEEENQRLQKEQADRAKEELDRLAVETRLKNERMVNRTQRLLNSGVMKGQVNFFVDEGIQISVEEIRNASEEAFKNFELAFMQSIREAEEKKKQEAERIAAEKAKNAPASMKLLLHAQGIRARQYPDVLDNPAAQEILDQVKILDSKVANYIVDQVERKLQ